MLFLTMNACSCVRVASSVVCGRSTACSLTQIGSGAAASNAFTSMDPAFEMS
jgi:hypothetical protein